MASPEERHLTWDRFHRDILVHGVPAVHPVPGEPYVELFFEPSSTRMGLRAACESQSTIHPQQLLHLRVRIVERENYRLLEVSTEHASLFRALYSLLTSTADLIQLSRLNPSRALQRIIDDFNELVAQVPPHTGELARGLFGELWTLERVLASRGPSAVAAWVGPFGEAHDFRAGQVEIEVKTTIQAQRIHSISSLEQLEPSLGATLFLLSLQLARAGEGAGISIASQINHLRERLADQESALRYFERALAALEVGAFDPALLAETYKLRTPAMLSPVDEQFPRMTRSLIGRIAPHAERILQAQYSLDLSDLGCPEGSSSFREVVG